MCIDGLTSNSLKRKISSTLTELRPGNWMPCHEQAGLYRHRTISIVMNLEDDL